MLKGTAMERKFGSVTCCRQKPVEVGEKRARLPAAKASLFQCLCGCFLLLLSAARSFAAEQPSDPILNLLLQKGILTEAEAQAARAEAERIRTNGPATTMPPMESRWQLSKAVKTIGLYGDIRMRFEDRRAEDPSGGSIELQRLRYVVRAGLRGELFDDYYFGFRLETSANPRSPWLTLGTSSSASPTYQGPFGKSTASFNIGQAYLGWRGVDWLDLTVGKMPNLLYTTPMVWDSDLNPEGLMERFKWSVGQADFFLNLGQFVYQDTNPTKTSEGYFNLGYTDSNLAFLLAWQAGLTYHLRTNLSLKVAPTLYNYTGHGANTTPPGPSVAPDFSGTFVGQGSTNNLTGQHAGAWSGFPLGFYDGFTANQTALNDLLVLDIPWEVNLRLNHLDLRLFGDYAQNLQGADRARAAYLAAQNAFQPMGGGEIALIPSAQTGDTKAWQVGFAVGNRDSLGLVNGTASRKHGWEFRTYWQHIEQYALDPNLLDSDFFEGRANLEGIYAALAYGLTDNMIGTFRYGYARRINEKIGTGGSNQDIPQMNPIQHYNLLQLDLTLKF